MGRKIEPFISHPVHSIRRFLLLQQTSTLESSIPTCAPTCEPSLSACVLCTADADRHGVSILRKAPPYIPPRHLVPTPTNLVDVHSATPSVMRFVRASDGSALPSTPARRGRHQCGPRGLSRSTPISAACLRSQL